MIRPSNSEMNSLKLMVETVVRLQKAQSIEGSLLEGRMGFLVEQVSADEADKLDDSIADTRKSLEDLIGILPAGKMARTVEYLKGKLKELPKPGFIAKMRLKGDKKNQAKQIQKSAAIMSQVQSTRDSMANAIQTLWKALSPTEYAKTGDKTKKIKEIPKLVTNRQQFPSYKILSKAVRDAYKPTGGTEGFFGKMASFFKGQGYGTGNATDFFNDVMDMSLEDLEKLAPIAQRIDNADTAGAQEAAQALSGVQDVVVQAPSGGGGSGTSSGAQQRTSGGGQTSTSSPGAAVEIPAGEEKPEEAAAEEPAAGGPGKRTYADISRAILASLEDDPNAKKILVALGGSQGFKAIAADKMVFESARRRQQPRWFRRNLLSLIFEEASLEDFERFVADSGVSDEELIKSVASELNNELGFDMITGLDAAEAATDAAEETEEEVAAEETEEEVAAEETEEEVAAGAAAASGQEVSTAMTDFAEIFNVDWYNSISDASRQALDAPGTPDILSDLSSDMQTALVPARNALKTEVERAVNDWINQNESTLLAAGFEDADFDKLEALVPKLTDTLIKKIDESSRRLTRESIYRSVHAFLNKRYRFALHGMLQEEVRRSINPGTFGEIEYSWEDLVVKRWSRIAGLEGE